MDKLILKSPSLFNKKLLLLIFLFLFSLHGFSQTYNISGIVTDSKTKETLIGVTIIIKNQSGKGTSTDKNGRYSLQLKKGDNTLEISYIGYQKQIVQLNVSDNLKKDIQLETSTYELEGIVISAQKEDENITAPQTGVERMEVEQMNKLPVLLGERDIIKTIQLTPGVKSAGEGNSGFFVRGGSADQNLILLDNVSLYNASHLMGFFSVFNSDVLNNVNLYKGSMPAQYGERLASILDVQQKNGDLNDYHLSGGIGLISSKLNIEGPIQKGRSSFLFGARRTYADAVAKLVGIKEMKNNTLYFYDLNMKLNLALSDKDQISLSGYLGEDKMGYTKIANIDWGNKFISLKWNRHINDKWNSSTILFYNQYDYSFKSNFGMESGVQSNIKDFGLKQEFTFSPNKNNFLRLGIQSTHHNLAPGDYKTGENNTLNLHHRYSLENAIYASNQMKLSDNLDIIYGLRLSAFMALGNGEYYTLDENKNLIESKWYKSSDIVKTYFDLEPRFSGVYKLNNTSSVKAAYARTTQNMHLLAFATQGIASDRWTSSSNNIKPQIADQFSLGYFRNFNNNMFEFSIEAYYKDLKNQIDFKDHADFEKTNVVETELLFGKGRAYGIELLLKKRTGKFTGWIGYTLSKSEKNIDGINDNRWYNALQDRTHDISIVGVYELTKKWTLSAAWVYCTGNAITYPSGKYQINEKDVMYYSERNGYRAPAYHRLDLGATWLLKKTSKFESELVFSLYNAYGRQNPYMIEFRNNSNDRDKTTAYQYSLFTYVPSITWNFKF